MRSMIENQRLSILPQFTRTETEIMTIWTRCVLKITVNLSLWANTITWVVVGIMAMGGTFVLLWKKFDDFLIAL